MPLIPMGDIPARHARRLGADTVAVRIGDETLSWGELDERATRRARALEAHGVRQNDLVTLALNNSYQFFEWTFAVWKLGATPHVVSSRIAAAEFRIEGFAQRLDARSQLLELSGALPGLVGLGHGDRAAGQQKDRQM